MKDEVLLVLTVIGTIIAFRLGFELGSCTSDNLLLSYITQH